MVSLKLCIFIRLLVARPNYKMSFLRKKKRDKWRMYHSEGIACPSPYKRVTNFTFLWNAWVISSWKKIFGCRRQFFLCVCVGGGGGGVCSFQPSPLLKFRSTLLPPRISNLIYKYTSISLFLGIRIPCGTKFLREFTFFRIGDLFVFSAGTNFCD